MRKWLNSMLVLLLICLGRASAQTAGPIEVGTLKKNNDWEVSVRFLEPVDFETSVTLNNYSVSTGEIVSGRVVETPHSVILIVSGLTVSNSYTLTMSNVRRADGTVIPTTSVSFVTRETSWASIGQRELGFLPEAVAVGVSGFDLMSGGSQMRDDYDESTFVYETVTGNFDCKVRVVMQEPSSADARAGLMVREMLDEGKGRPFDPLNTNDVFGRYIQLFVTPTNTVYGEPASNTHQGLARFYTLITDNPTFESTDPLELTNNAAPPYPNAWLRIRRRGPTFTLFRGTDGTNWVQLGAYTFPSEDARGPLPQTLYVGPNFSPENANIPISSGARRLFLAQFRDFEVVPTNEPTEPPTLEIVRSGNEVVITWEGGGTLETSTTLAPDDWTAISGSSPYRTEAGVHHRFYRVRL